MAKERDLVFDALKLFAIFLVLWGHAIQSLLSSDPHSEPVYLLIYSFHMPLFMALVGFFSGKAMELPFSRFLARKGRQLLLPTLTVGLGFVAIGLFEGDLRGGVHSYVEGFWFLKSAFCCFLLYYVAVKIAPRRWMGVVVSLAVSMFCYRYKLVLMYPCFLFGVLVRRHIVIIKANAGLFSLLSGGLFAGLLLFWDARFMGLPKVFEAVGGIPGWAVSYSFILADGLAGTLFFISLFEFLAGHVPSTAAGKRMCGWGADTLGIYLFQTFILEIGLRDVLNFDGMGFVAFNFVVAPAVSLVTLLICLWLISLVKKSGWLSFMILGGKMPRGRCALPKSDKP